jgi:uncharacterized protein involved in response to NO
MPEKPRRQRGSETSPADEKIEFPAFGHYSDAMNRPIHPFLSYAFRPFFLLNALFALVAIVLWVMVLQGRGPTTLPPNTMLWHGHEMLVGFAMATIAGFILTAVATWSDRPPVNGLSLTMLILAWVAGRIAMLLAGLLPAWLVAAFDMAFPLLLCFFTAREIIRAGNRRNYPIVGITALLAILNLVYHLGTLQLLPGADRVAVFLMIHTILLLITVIGGRVIPNFTANWLRARGASRLPVNNVPVDRLTIFLTLAVGIGASTVPTSPVTGILALAAAVLHVVRLSRWRGLATTDEPLMFVLHIAYSWLPIGYALMGCVVFGWVFAPTTALHALTMGAIGGMILAMTTRVPLGHTGRPLTASRLTVVAYLMLTLAVLVRVLGPLISADYLATVEWSAAAWVFAFVIFVWVYWPVLTRAREDAV